MADIKVQSISDYCKMVGAECIHPLVGVLDFSKLPPILFDHPMRVFDYYAIYLKGSKYTELHYGNSMYDYKEGALVFFGPGQLAGSENDGEYHQVYGHVLMFHRDLLAGTPLQALMSKYSFFDYSTNEALFPTSREKTLLVDIFGKIADELHPFWGEDEFRKNKMDDNLLCSKIDREVVVDYIKLVLDICLRAYDRQFESLPAINNDILARFEKLCEAYYESDLPRKEGLLTVQYCADKLCYSVNYLSDLIRKYTVSHPKSISRARP